MMNAAFREVIAAGDDARRDLFLTTAGRLGTAVQNVEKDFWVCWVLDALFHGLLPMVHDSCSKAEHRCPKPSD